VKKLGAAKVMKPCGELNGVTEAGLEWVLFDCGAWSLGGWKHGWRFSDGRKSVFGWVMSGGSGPKQQVG
jgi:hypothetical protein